MFNNPELVSFFACFVFEQRYFPSLKPSKKRNEENLSIEKRNDSHAAFTNYSHECFNLADLSEEPRVNNESWSFNSSAA